MLETYLHKVEDRLSDVEPNYVEKTLVQRMTDQYNQASFGTINSSSKLKVLSRLKDSPGRESYLREVEISKHRIALTRFRLCSHSLEIERGRYQDLNRQERLCHYCKTRGKDEVEDEGHFLISCPLYNELRERFLPQNIVNHNILSREDKITQILSDELNIKSVAKFIHQAFEIREISLDALSSIKCMVDQVEKYIADASDPLKHSFTINHSSEDGLKIILFRNGSFRAKSSNEAGLKITLSRISP